MESSGSAAAAAAEAPMEAVAAPRAAFHVQNLSSVLNNPQVHASEAIRQHHLQRCGRRFDPGALRGHRVA
jgi:hypothetical protein